MTPEQALKHIFIDDEQDVWVMIDDTPYCLNTRKARFEYFRGRGTKEDVARYDGPIRELHFEQ